MKDSRYDSIGVLIETGHIKTIGEIFIYIPKTTVYKDLGVNYNRFDRAIADPTIFRMQELIRLADMFGLDRKRLIDMAYEQFLDIDRGNQKRLTILK